MSRMGAADTKWIFVWGRGALAETKPDFASLKRTLAET